MLYKLRGYQERAVKKMIWSTTLEGGSIVSLPTGSGKSLIIAEFAKRIGKPILILVPSKEILEQDFSKLKAVVPEKEIGIFSASMKSKEIKEYTLATIQSAYKYPELFTHYDVALIDECHLLNPKKLDGMYNAFFRAIGSPKVIGLTATPYRLDSFYRATGKRWAPWETVTTIKMICRYKDRFWKNMIYVLNTGELTNNGFLCPLTYKDMTLFSHWEIPTNKSGSDFNLEAYESLILPKERAIITHILGLKEKSVLIFCTSVDQAERMAEATNSAVVSAKTLPKERAKIITDFKKGGVKRVFNVGVLTTGFDHPSLDAIVLLRPTRSLNLYNQMLGRGSRKSEGKETCTIYDFSGTVKELGRIEDIRVDKIEGKWDVITKAGPMHGKELYSYDIMAKKANDEVEYEGHR